MYYLHKVNVLLEETAYENNFLELKQSLQKAESIGEAAEITMEISFVDKMESEEGVLWITDKAEWANRLFAKKLPVLVFLHQGNMGEDFSAFRYGMEKPEELDMDYLEGVYRRLCRLPWDILETERCLLRETKEEDVPFFYKIYSDSAITQYMEDLYPEVEQEKQYVREYIDKVYSFYDFGVWTVIEKASGDIIGRAGLSYREGFENPELGFVIGTRWQRKGFATEVCRAILQYGRQQFDFETINALVRPENEISLKLCQKLGFCYKKEVELEGIKHAWLEKK